MISKKEIIKTYLIEDNIDFYAELKNTLEKSPNTTSDNNNEQSNCLITYEPLELDNITLECNHKFNYLPFVKAISFDIDNYIYKDFLNYELKCPFCRKIHTKRPIPYNYNYNVYLPYIHPPYEEIKKNKKEILKTKKEAQKKERKESIIAKRAFEKEEKRKEAILKKEKYKEEKRKEAILKKEKSKEEKRKEAILNVYSHSAIESCLTGRTNVYESERIDIKKEKSKEEKNKEAFINVYSTD